MLHEYLQEEEEDENTIKDLFAEPSIFKPRLSFKRRKNAMEKGNISVSSLDLTGNVNLKRKKLSKMASLASFITTPMKPVTRVGEALQRSFSSSKISSPSIKRSPGIMSNISSPTATMKRSISSITKSFSNSAADTVKYKFPTPIRTKPKVLSSWSNDVASNKARQMPVREIKRQEAIYEIYRGEQDVISDLKTVQKVYHDSLVNLKLLSDEDLKQIFGNIFNLIPVHEKLQNLLTSLRDKEGATQSISPAFKTWIPELSHYVSYCSNMVRSKSLLDERRSLDSHFRDFLQRCQESPFSRKLDLWNFLDVPRNRLMKYPLLLKEVLKYSEPGSPDYTQLSEVALSLSSVIQQVDLKTGQEECMLTLQKLEFLDDNQKDSAFHQATQVVCAGMLRNNRGTKLHVILFDTILVLTREATRGRGLVYQVWRNPIPAPFLQLEEINEGETRKGSFRSSLTASQKCKHVLKVTSCEANRSVSYTLIAADEHSRKQWLMCFRKVIADNATEPMCTDSKPLGVLENLAAAVHGFKDNIENDSRLSCEAKLRGVVTTPMKVKARQAKKCLVDQRNIKNHPGVVRSGMQHARTRSYNGRNLVTADYHLRERRKCASSSNLLEVR